MKTAEVEKIKELCYQKFAQKIGHIVPTDEIVDWLLCKLTPEPSPLTEIGFGDYCLIEQKNYGQENEMYLHKIVGVLESNTWVDVPVQCPATETIHTELVKVVRAICCGVSETNVRMYRISDIKPNNKFKT